MTGVVTWISTWIILILLLVILSTTSWGKSIVYYLLWLAIALLLVSHADELTQMFNIQSLNLNG